MRYLTATMLLSVLSAALVHAQDSVSLKVDGPGVKDVEKVVMVPKIVTYKVVDRFPAEVKVVNPTPNSRYTWTVPPGVYAVPRGHVLEIRAAPKGETVVDVTVETLDLKVGTFTFTTGQITILVGDVPQPPGPDPKPPTPDPKPPAPPGPAAKLRVLVVYESAELSRLPPTQYLVLFAKDVRDYLNAKCAPGADGKTKEWRIWDKDVEVAGDAAHWKADLALPRSALPWVVISDGGKVLHSGPLPADVADTLTLLKKFGG